MVSAFSVPKAKRNEPVSLNPGPGQYNPENSPKVVNKSDPNYSFGKDGKKQFKELVPGPGSYEPDSSLVNEKKPSFSIKVRRQDKINQLPVGPGSYQPSYNFPKQQSPAFSMKGKSNLNQDSKQPGPGQYQLKSTLQMKKSGHKFNRQLRNQYYSSKTPGPGSYQYQTAVFKYGSKQDPSYIFGAKNEIKNQKNVPGPGRYDDKIGVYSKIGGIISRDMHSSMILSKTPGPGNYEEHGNFIKEKQPSWSLSKSSRDYMQRGNIIGPGQYEVEKKFKDVLNSPPSYHFGNDSKIKSRIDRNPGPGQYEQNILRSRKSVRIGEKIKESDRNYVPGPGSYEQEKYLHESWFAGGGKYSLGKSSRDNMKINKEPGPGAYEYKNKNNNSRLKNSNNPNPGPGQYDLKPYFADVPKYLLPDK